MLGQFRGSVGYIDPAVSYEDIQTMPVSGQSDTANIHITPKYTVRYWLQEYDKATGKTSYVLKEKAESGAAIINSTAADAASALDRNCTADVKTFDGYVFNASKSISKGTVADDNSTVLDLYYDRYVSVKFDSQGGSYTPETQKIAIGNKASEPKDPSKKVIPSKAGTT